MTTHDEQLDFFTDPSVVDDPFPFLERTRKRCPVARLPHHNVIAITGYDAANQVWRDHATFSSCNSVTGPFPGLPFAAEGDDIVDLIEAHRVALPMSEYLVTQDPPSHSALRGLLMRLLTPSRLKQNEEFIERLARRQVAQVLTKGTVNLLTEFSSPFALLVIADLLGIPEKDHADFAFGLGQGQPGTVGGGTKRPPMDPLAFLVDTFTTYVEDRRAHPREDVLTHLATATYPDGTIPEVIDVVRTATFLFAAGQDTVARLMTTAVQVLADDPELQTRLRADPRRIPDLLEEVLRLEGPVKSIGRLARVSTTLEGVEIPAGTNVVIFPHAANRDPVRFEEPDRLNIDRDNARTHVAFGRGVHSCPGGPLARSEARIAVELLLSTTASIEIDEAFHGPIDDRGYAYEATYVLRGLTELHVKLTPAQHDLPSGSRTGGPAVGDPQS